MAAVLNLITLSLITNICCFDLSRSHKQCSKDPGQHITTQTVCSILISGSKSVIENTTPQVTNTYTRQQLNLHSAVEADPTSVCAGSLPWLPGCRHLVTA